MAPEYLLVRQPLRGSTDEAFRQAAEIIRSKADDLMAESNAIEAELPNMLRTEEFHIKRDRRWILYHRSIDFSRAAKLIDPTPTEAEDDK